MAHYYEDFDIGQECVTLGRTITEADIINFAGLTGDWYELHTNAEKAAKSMYGQRVAHGALIFSISTGLLMQLGQPYDTLLAFYGVDKLRFHRPVFIGDTVRVRRKVTAKDVRDERSGIVSFVNDVINQHEQRVVSYTASLLYQRREGMQG